MSLDIDTRLHLLFEHDVDTEARIIHLYGEIGQEYDSRDFDLALSELERLGDGPVTIRINSEGGSVYDALAMIARMRISPCQLITEGYGSVMSAATLIFAAGNQRRMSTLCWSMVHEISNDGITSGTASTIRTELRQMEREQKLWYELMGQLTKQPATWWEKAANKKDLYLTAQQCLELGMADEIF